MAASRKKKPPGSSASLRAETRATQAAARPVVKKTPAKFPGKQPTPAQLAQKVGKRDELGYFRTNQGGVYDPGSGRILYPRGKKGG